MLLNDHLADTGETLFRWRSFVLTAFIPVIVFAIWMGEPIELRFGETANTIYELACIGLVFAGVALRAYTVGFVPANTSGRNRKTQVADSLNTTGIYSVVRNPLYLANALGYVGAALYSQWLSIAVVMVIVLVLYFERIIAAEERFLLRKFGRDYSAWAQRTPAFFPHWSNWTPPTLRFSWRTVLRREHSSWLGTLVLLYILETVSMLSEGDHLADHPWPTWLILVAFALQVIILLVKRNTTLLNVEGR